MEKIMKRNRNPLGIIPETSEEEESLTLENDILPTNITINEDEAIFVYSKKPIIRFLSKFAVAFNKNNYNINNQNNHDILLSNTDDKIEKRQSKIKNTDDSCSYLNKSATESTINSNILTVKNLNKTELVSPIKPLRQQYRSNFQEKSLDKIEPTLQTQLCDLLVSSNIENSDAQQHQHILCTLETSSIKPLNLCTKELSALENVSIPALLVPNTLPKTESSKRRQYKSIIKVYLPPNKMYGIKSKNNFAINKTLSNNSNLLNINGFNLKQVNNLTKESGSISPIQTKKSFIEKNENKTFKKCIINLQKIPNKSNSCFKNNHNEEINIGNDGFNSNNTIEASSIISASASLNHFKHNSNDDSIFSGFESSSSTLSLTKQPENTLTPTLTSFYKRKCQLMENLKNQKHQTYEAITSNNESFLQQFTAARKRQLNISAKLKNYKAKSNPKVFVMSRSASLSDNLAEEPVVKIFVPFRVRIEIIVKLILFISFYVVVV